MAERKPIRIDMTPMVDVVMLLLIFFMTTTSFKPPEDLSVALPSSHSEIKVPEAGLILISVGSDGTIFIGIDGRPGSQTFPEDFVAALQQARMESPMARIVVKADRMVPYEIMSDIMDAFQQNQVQTFSLVTDLETDGGPGGGAGH